MAQNQNTEGVSIAPSVTTPDPSAMLDVQSSNKGVLIPRMAESDKNSINNPAEGLLIYQTDNASGYYYYDGSNWVPLGGNQKMAKVTFSEMTAMSNNLTNDDLGLMVFVTSNPQVFCVGEGLEHTSPVWGVWAFDNFSGCGQWVRLVDGHLSDPCNQACISNNTPAGTGN